MPHELTDPASYLTIVLVIPLFVVTLFKATYDEGAARGAVGPSRAIALTESAAFQAHVDNLQEFAVAAGDQVDRFQSVPLATAVGRSFRAHFPETANLLKQWHESMDGSIDKRFRDRILQESGDLNLGIGNSVWNLLTNVAEGGVATSDLHWWVAPVGPDRIMVGDGENVWIVSATLPNSTDEVAKLLESVGGAVARVDSLPETIEWSNARARRMELRSALRDALDVVEHTHSIRLAPDCSLCPKWLL
jgi:hypothetical protein